MLYKETVSPELLDLTGRFMEDKVFDNFRLVGGTALSLQSGHRIECALSLPDNVARKSGRQGWRDRSLAPL